MLHSLNNIIAEEKASADSLNIFTISTVPMSFAEDVFLLDNICFVTDQTEVYAIDVLNKENPLILNKFIDSIYSYAVCGYKGTYGEYNVFVGSAGDTKRGLFYLQFLNNEFNLRLGESYSAVRDLFYDSPYLYVAGDDGFRIYYADNGFFSLISCINITNLKGIHIKDTLAFMVSDVDSLLRIFNIADRQKPKLISKLIVGKAPWEVNVTGNYAFVLVEGQFVTIDISNLVNPIILNRFSFSHGQSEGRIFIENNYVYIGHVNYGIEILDITNPAAPTMVGYYYYPLKFGMGALGVVVKNKTIYTGFTTNGFKIFQFCPNGFLFDMQYSSCVNYEILDTIEILLTKENTSLPFRNAEVYLTDFKGNKITESKYPDENGKIYFEMIKSDTFPLYIVAKNLITIGQIEQNKVYTNYKRFASIETMREIPVLKEVDYAIKVLEYITYPPETLKTNTKPSIGANVKCYDEKGKIYFNTLTDNNGDVSYLFNLKSNLRLFVEIDKTGFVKEIREIMPYIWSKSGYGLGLNNQRKVVRELNSDRMHIVYTDGDSIVYGYSDNFGGIWNLEKIGKGKNPSLVKTTEGLIAMWNNGTNIEYAVKSSPWGGYSQYPMLWSSEPVLFSSWESDRKIGGYIGYRYEGLNRGDLIVGVWKDEDIGNIEFDTVFTYTGTTDRVVPMFSPVVVPYYDVATLSESYMAACIDTGWHLVGSRWNGSISNWSYFDFISPVNQKAQNPSGDYDNRVTIFIWEVDNGDGTTEIWNSKYGRVSFGRGVNRYPVSRNVVQSSYIKDYDKIIGYRAGYSDTLTPESYVIYDGDDSIYSMDAVYKKGLIETKFYYCWFEGSNGEYRFKSKVRSYSQNVLPYSSGEPTDTIDGVIISPLREYVKGNFKIERMVYEVGGMNREMNYLVKVKIEDKNPHIPEVVQIDGEVYGVIYGGPGEKVLEIVVPKEKYEGDRKIEISIDRKKGDKNRVAKIEVYEYEEEVGVISMVKGGIKAEGKETVEEKYESMINNIRYNEGNGRIEYMMNGAGDVKIRVMDITGRIVEKKEMGYQVKGEYGMDIKIKKGIYFVVIDVGGIEYTKKIVRVR
ncbi:MAG: T9SS type A sorting domain-containing protein [candidate division WOR-3 bacterium]